MSHINKMVNSQIKTNKKKKFILENSTETKKVILTKNTVMEQKYIKLHKHM